MNALCCPSSRDAALRSYLHHMDMNIFNPYILFMEHYGRRHCMNWTCKKDSHFLCNVYDNSFENEKVEYDNNLCGVQSSLA